MRWLFRLGRPPAAHYGRKALAHRSQSSPCWTQGRSKSESDRRSVRSTVPFVASLWLFSGSFPLPWSCPPLKQLWCLLLLSHLSLQMQRAPRLSLTLLSSNCYFRRRWILQLRASPVLFSCLDEILWWLLKVVMQCVGGKCRVWRRRDTD